MMHLSYILLTEMFLGVLGIALVAAFCTTFCRACSRYRAEQRELLRRSEQTRYPSSIYSIPFPRVSQQETEDVREPRYSQDANEPPRYSTTVYCEPPPSYNELGLKPDDLPPAYTEHNVPVYPITPQPNTYMLQSQTRLQP